MNLKWHSFPSDPPLRSGEYLVQHGYGSKCIMTVSKFDRSLGEFGILLADDWVRYTDVVAWMYKPVPYEKT